MKIIGLDGREYSMNLKKLERRCEKPSSLHLSARELLHKVLVGCNIYEEVTLLGCRNKGSVLVADFFIPSHPSIVEVHGQQHYKFVKHFHINEQGFKRYKDNDLVKQDWAELNDIIYIELPFNKQSKWKDIIYDKLV